MRGALFPNNMPGTSSLVAPSSQAELLALRRRCARVIWALVPNQRGVGRLYFSGSLSSNKGASPSNGRGSSSSIGTSASGHSRDAHGASAATSPPVTGGQKRGSAQPHVCGQGHGPVPLPGAGAGNSEEGSRSAPSNGSWGGTGRRQGQGQGSSGQDQRFATTAGAAAARPTAALATEKTASTDSADASPSAGQTDISSSNNNEAEDEEEEEIILSEIERSILDVFSDAYCNKHLIYCLVERILVRLLPELAEKGVLDLWAERLP